MDIQAIIFQYITGDSNVCSYFGEFESYPAVFTTTIPEAVGLGDKPVVVIDVPNEDEDSDTFTEEYRQSDTLIRLYSKPRGSDLALVNAAEALRAHLKAWPSGAVSGGVMIGASVSGPTIAPVNSPDERGRIISINTLIKDT